MLSYDIVNLLYKSKINLQNNKKLYIHNLTFDEIMSHASAPSYDILCKSTNQISPQNNKKLYIHNLTLDEIMARASAPTYQMIMFSTNYNKI
jgi:hypothetical protein